MNPLVDLWRREITGTSLRMIRHAWIHDEEYAIALAEEAVRNGAAVEEVAALLDDLRTTSARKP
jgi:glycine/D-amino acid oxidase-like deaminating enzyme